MELGPEQPKRAAIYTRIFLDQNGDRLGVTRQFEDCVNLAARLGWDVVAHHDDDDISAYSGHTRPGFGALLDAMKTSQIDAVICWHTDRLYRSMRDLERLIEIAEAARISIKTVNAGDLDLSTTAGRMVARILGSVARQESEHKGERQKRANIQKAEAGRWQTASRTFGYDMTGVPVEKEAAAYRRAVSDILAGKSIRRVSIEWNERGILTTKGKTWNSPRVRRLLVNPRYAALKTHNGKVIGPGDWTPLIDTETHEGLVAYLSHPTRVKCTSFERKYPGSGVYRCGKCDGPMRAGQPADGKRTYICREHSHLVRKGEPLDAYVTAVVLEKLAEPDAHLLLDNSEVDLANLQDRRAALRAKMDDYTAMFNNDEIDGSQFRRGTAELRAKLAVVESQLSTAIRTSPVATLLADQANIWERWQRMSPAIRGQVFDELVVVRVLPCDVKGRGRGFDPALIDIQWRQEAD